MNSEIFGNGFEEEMRHCEETSEKLAKSARLLDKWERTLRVKQSEVEQLRLEADKELANRFSELLDREAKVDEKLSLMRGCVDAIGVMGPMEDTETLTVEKETQESFYLEEAPDGSDELMENLPSRRDVDAMTQVVKRGRRATHGDTPVGQTIWKMRNADWEHQNVSTFKASSPQRSVGVVTRSAHKRQLSEGGNYTTDA